MNRNRVRHVLKIVPLVILGVAVFGFVVMWLWNWLMPSLFGLKTIGYWQALGLVVLSRIFFGGCRGMGGHDGRWRHRMMERWERMTPEERERFRQGFASRCGHLSPHDTPPTE